MAVWTLFERMFFYLEMLRLQKQCYPTEARRPRKTLGRGFEKTAFRKSFSDSIVLSVEWAACELHSNDPRNSVWSIWLVCGPTLDDVQALQFGSNYFAENWLKMDNLQDPDSQILFTFLHTNVEFGVVSKPFEFDCLPKIYRLNAAHTCGICTWSKSGEHSGLSFTWMRETSSKANKFRIFLDHHTAGLLSRAFKTRIPFVKIPVELFHGSH